MSDAGPSIDAVRACRERLGSRVLRTPVHEWKGARISSLLEPGTEVVLKLELFQHTGSFKPRGALNVISALAPEALARGITAVSAGNHAIAAAYAAKVAGTHAKVVMIRTASPVRIARAQSYGAEVLLADDGQSAFAMVESIVAEEGRAFVHPFEGPLTAEGTGTISLEFSEQAGPLDAIIVPIGGGGLCGGMAAAIKQLQPSCEVFGVEPEGADTMHRSFASGEVVTIPKVNTIADSLAPPMSLPYSFGLCRRYVDQLVKISDNDMRQAMRLLFDEMKLGVEPAGAAATAALTGPLRNRLAGRRIGVIVCGANIDISSFAAHLSQTEPA